MKSGFIRRINYLDLNKIIVLERKCFNEKMAYSPRQLKYLITKANSCCLGEIESDIMRGFIIILYKNGTKVAGVETLNVDPKYHGNGIGFNLLNAAEFDMILKGMKKIKLEVSVGNNIALNLYEKFGFKKESYLKNYYYHKHFGTNDAYKMVKELAS